MHICETCGAQIEKNVCKQCGSAVFNDERATVRITAINYSPERAKEISQKYMAPFIKGTIQRLQLQQAE